jgi:hypothetical protein
VVEGGAEAEIWEQTTRMRLWWNSSPKERPVPSPWKKPAETTFEL